MSAERKDENVAIFLVGLPATGKSTFLESLKKSADFNEVARDPFVFSTDAMIHSLAEEEGTTYNQSFDDLYLRAEKIMFDLLAKAIEDGRDIIIDRTNLTVKSRKRFINRFSKEMAIMAIVMDWDLISDVEIHTRMEKRNTHKVPMNIIASMRASATKPTLDEGFDQIVICDPMSPHLNVIEVITPKN